MGKYWQLLIGCMIWNYFCKLLKDQSSLGENDKIVSLLWSGGFSDFDADFGSILRILAPKSGGAGLNTKANLISYPDLTLSLEMSHISSDRVRSGYEIKANLPRATS